MRILLKHFKFKKIPYRETFQWFVAQHQCWSPGFCLPLTWSWAVPVLNSSCSCRENPSMNLPPSSRLSFYLRPWLRAIKDTASWPLLSDLGKKKVWETQAAQRELSLVPGAVALQGCCGGVSIRARIPISNRPVAASSRARWCFRAAD